MRKQVSAAQKHGIEKLSDYAHARKRTEMYLGQRAPHEQDVLIYNDNMIPTLETVQWVPALYTAFREALDNAADEVIGHGAGTRIDVTYDETTMEMSIEDNGRGIPFEFDKVHNNHIATMVLTETKSGRNFGDRGETAGTNGIGVSVVNFCSEYMHVEIVRDGKKFTQSFMENPLPNTEQLVTKKATIKKTSSTKTGTKITFKPSAQVFPDMILPERFVRSRVVDVAVSNPLIRFYYNGERIKVSPFIEKTIFPDINPIVIDIKEDDVKTKFVLVPNFSEKEEFVHTLVNNIPAFNGGVHIDNFKRGFYSGLIDALARESKKRKVTPNRLDISEGLLIFNVTTMKAPDFDSQSKTRLTNTNIGNIIKKHLSDEEFYKNVIRKNRDWIEKIYERAEERTHKKDLQDVKKLSKQAKKVKVKNYKPANGKDRSKCILFLAEGESAISGFGKVRDQEIHGGLGLRGKILNVNGIPTKKILENDALTNIINAIGLTVGETAVRKELEYNKVYIAADADPDGANITALLINFFYTYWPELFDDTKNPFLHVFMTPFIIAEKGKTRKYWYADDYQKFKPEDYKGWSITRAKGLGALIKEDWEYAVKSPKSVAITNDPEMKEALDIIFNEKRADDRKAWLEMHDV